MIITLVSEAVVAGTRSTLDVNRRIGYQKQRCYMFGRWSDGSRTNVDAPFVPLSTRKLGSIMCVVY